MNIFKKQQEEPSVAATPEEVTPIEQAPPRYITEREIAEASAILQKYMKGKANLDARVIEDERWWKGQHWEVIRRKAKSTGPEPTSRYLFNTITNKHADIMDNYPEAVALPRERSDSESAQTLSDILPVIFKYNGFEDVYSNNSWELLKHGTAVYGVFWDSHKDGIGDITINAIDLLRIYWQPGVTDIQDSRNLFILDLIDTDLLDELYPDNKGKFKGTNIGVKHYEYDDDVDTSDKTVVVDWYYKKSVDGRTLLHYVKFAGNEVLYSSEDDPACQGRGFYDHGKYPVVLNVLYPEKGTPAGFGEVAICKDPQLYIDKLMGNILETSLMNTKRRFFARRSMSINKEQLLDNSEPLIEVDGDIDESRLREFAPRDVSPVYANIVQMKIEEMKDTSSNRDVNSGGSGGGVTAASAIAALQEAGNKNSRDIISGLYRDFVDITHFVIELIRQFYDETRSFRITNKMTMPEGAIPGMGMPGMGQPMGQSMAQPEYQFVEFNNKGIKEQVNGGFARKPIFDIDVRAQRQSPFSVLSQNELAKELLAMGAFNPQRAQEMQGALKLMEFEGKEEVMDYVAQGQTLLNMLMQTQQELVMLKASLGLPLEGQGMPMGGGGAPTPQVKPSTPTNDGIMESRAPRTSYAENLAKRSAPRVGQ